MATLHMPEGNLPTVLFADDNGVSEQQPMWVDADNLGQSITKAQGRNLVRRLSHGYLSSNLILPGQQPPNVVVLYSENQTLLFPNIFAIIAAGGTVATCPWQATVEELLYRVKILSPTAILCSKSSLDRALEAQRRLKHKVELLVQDSVGMDVVLQRNNTSLLSNQERDWDQSWTEDIANRASVIVFSSGTTGFPKGITISQRNIIAMVYQIRSRWSTMLRARTQWPRTLGLLDSSHVAGMLVNCFIPLGAGLTNYLAPGANIDLVLSTLEKEHINFLFAVPPILQRLAAHPRWPTVDLSSLQHATSGAARCSPEIQKAITKRMPEGTFCQQAWGMTELTCLATMPVPGVLGPWESVGTALDGNKIKICDQDGVEVPQGRSGEIYIAGPTKTNGYHGQSEKQRQEAFINEWMRTGDLGHVDDKGYLYITGRNKDLIKYNGAQVSPREIELVIKAHEAVADAAVVGLETDDGNELPTAFVVLSDGKHAGADITADIAAFTAKRVSPYKRLRGGVHVTDEIPKNPMGKILYQELRLKLQELRKGPTQPKL